MQFKRSAGVFVAAITLLLAGPLLSLIGATFGTWSIASIGDRGLSGVFLALVVLGGIVSFAGVILMIVAVHRALVKIGPWLRSTPFLCGLSLRLGRIGPRTSSVGVSQISTAVGGPLFHRCTERATALS